MLGVGLGMSDVVTCPNRRHRILPWRGVNYVPFLDVGTRKDTATWQIQRVVLICLNGFVSLDLNA